MCVVWLRREPALGGEKFTSRFQVSLERDRRMRLAYEQIGCTGAEIARYLDMDPITASRAVDRAKLRQFTV